MSSFSRPDFVEEFSFRTKVNYYTLMRNQALEDNDHRKFEYYDRELKHIRQQMSSKGYVISRSYEVTQLINSLIGLLIFPEQDCFNLLKYSIETLEESLPALNKIITANDGKYNNTYRDYREWILPQKEKLSEEETQKAFEAFPFQQPTPFTIANHMRNAVAHNHVSIRPISRGGIITSVVFHDEGFGEIMRGKGFIKYERAIPRELRNVSNDARCGRFSLEIDVDLLEQVLVNLCDLINGLARNA